jgi:hypothetical protein
VSAPAGSGVAVTANTPSFVFRPDVPGEYALQLTASDAATSGSDAMRVTAEPLFSVTAPIAFSIDGASAARSDQATLSLRTSAHYAGSPVTFTATSSAAWLTAPPNGTFAAAGAEALVPLQLNLDELRRMEDGSHEASVTLAPDGGWTSTSATVTLNLALPFVRTVAPYVAYVGEASRVRLYGKNLLGANGQSLFVGGTEALNIVATGDSAATIDLPPLSAGTYTVRIGHALDIGREMGRIVVRSPPVYQDVGGIDIGGALQSFEYDAERDAIYYVMFAPNGLHFAFRLRNDGTGNWLADFLPLTPLNFEPKALALSADGTEILVTSLTCWVHRINADTFEILESAQHPSCEPGSEFSALAPLADGRVLVNESRLNSGDLILEYPGFAASDVLPSRRGAFLVLNAYGDRLLDVQSQAAQPAVDIYDVGGASRSVNIQAHPAGVHPSNVSMSANGSRTLHAANVYDADLNLIGRLAGNWSMVGSALNAQGTRAVVLDLDNNAFYVHDVSAPGPEFPQIGPEVVLPDDITSIERVFVPPAGGAVFGMAFVSNGPRGFHRFYVRTHPALTR